MALEPFVANYQVFNGGKRLGEATMRLVRDGEALRGILNAYGLFEQSAAFTQCDARRNTMSKTPAGQGSGTPPRRQHEQRRRADQATLQ